jgi:hypothetical protein
MTAKTAPKTPKQQRAEDAEQYERFRQFAREHGADGDPEASEGAVEKIIRRPASDQT